MTFRAKQMPFPKKTININKINSLKIKSPMPILDHGIWNPQDEAGLSFFYKQFFYV
jgi:hypothetical protein